MRILTGPHPFTLLAGSSTDSARLDLSADTTSRDGHSSFIALDRNLGQAIETRLRYGETLDPQVRRALKRLEQGHAIDMRLKGPLLAFCEARKIPVMTFENLPETHLAPHFEDSAESEDLKVAYIKALFQKIHDIHSGLQVSENELFLHMQKFFEPTREPVPNRITIGKLFRGDFDSLNAILESAVRVLRVFNHHLHPFAGLPIVVIDPNAPEQTQWESAKNLLQQRLSTSLTSASGRAEIFELTMSTMHANLHLTSTLSAIRFRQLCLLFRIHLPPKTSEEAELQKRQCTLHQLGIAEEIRIKKQGGWTEKAFQRFLIGLDPAPQKFLTLLEKATAPVPAQETIPTAATNPSETQSPTDAAIASALAMMPVPAGAESETDAILQRWQTTPVALQGLIEFLKARYGLSLVEARSQLLRDPDLRQIILADLRMRPVVADTEPQPETPVLQQDVLDQMPAPEVAPSSTPASENIATADRLPEKLPEPTPEIDLRNGGHRPPRRPTSSRPPIISSPRSTTPEATLPKTDISLQPSTTQVDRPAPRKRRGEEILHPEVIIRTRDGRRSPIQEQPAPVSTVIIRNANPPARDADAPIERSATLSLALGQALQERERARAREWVEHVALKTIPPEVPEPAPAPASPLAPEPEPTPAPSIEAPAAKPIARRDVATEQDALAKFLAARAAEKINYEHIIDTQPEAWIVLEDDNKVQWHKFLKQRYEKNRAIRSEIFADTALGGRAMTLLVTPYSTLIVMSDPVSLALGKKMRIVTPTQMQQLLENDDASLDFQNSPFRRDDFILWNDFEGRPKEDIIARRRHILQSQLDLKSRAELNEHDIDFLNRSGGNPLTKTLPRFILFTLLSHGDFESVALTLFAPLQKHIKNRGVRTHHGLLAEPAFLDFSTEYESWQKQFLGDNAKPLERRHLTTPLLALLASSSK